MSKFVFTKYDMKRAFINGKYDLPTIEFEKNLKELEIRRRKEMKK